MRPIHVYGIDPGLVHTGIVRLSFYPAEKQIVVGTFVTQGADPSEVSSFIGSHGDDEVHVFIEAYRPRHNYDTNPKMTEAVQRIHHAIRGSKVINNTGVKKVIKRSLMELLGLWIFATKTHHQDLRAGAYIALYGIVKDDRLNEILADVVSDHLDGRTWNVLH